LQSTNPSGHGVLGVLAMLKKEFSAETKTLLTRTAKITSKIILFILIKGSFDKFNCLANNYKLSRSFLFNSILSKSFLVLFFASFYEIEKSGGLYLFSPSLFENLRVIFFQNNKN